MISKLELPTEIHRQHTTCQSYRVPLKSSGAPSEPIFRDTNRILERSKPAATNHGRSLPEPARRRMKVFSLENAHRQSDEQCPRQTRSASRFRWIAQTRHRTPAARSGRDEVLFRRLSDGMRTSMNCGVPFRWKGGLIGPHLVRLLRQGSRRLDVDVDVTRLGIFGQFSPFRSSHLSCLQARETGS